jgi:predicted ester cyclase
MLKSQNPGDILRQTIETLLTTGDVSGLEQHPGMEALSKNFAKVKSAFPDIKTEFVQQLTEGDQVASHWILHGTHTGELFGIAPTGKTVKFQNLSIARIENGKIVQYNSEIGWLSILMQIGVLPIHK